MDDGRRLAINEAVRSSVLVAETGPADVTEIRRTAWGRFRQLPTHLSSINSELIVAVCKETDCSSQGFPTAVENVSRFAKREERQQLNGQGDKLAGPCPCCRRFTNQPVEQPSSIQH